MVKYGVLVPKIKMQTFIFEKNSKQISRIYFLCFYKRFTCFMKNQNILLHFEIILQPEKCLIHSFLTDRVLESYLFTFTLFLLFTLSSTAIIILSSNVSISYCSSSLILQLILSLAE